MKRVGFLGLGIMGKPMARNLLQKGFHVIGVAGHAQNAIDALIPLGLQIESTPKAVAERADMVITCVPDSSDVQEVYLGPEGLIHGASPGQVFVDMSTIAPDVAIHVAEKLAERQAHFLDAPISGGQQGAEQGTLSVMIGGDASAVEKVRPVLEAIAKTIVHVGPSGCGQYTKCANQILCAVTWQAIAEGMALAVKAGADPEKVLQAISSGAARCWALEVRAPRVLKGDFQPGFMARLQYKDLKIVRDAATAMGVPTPVASLVTEFYKILVERGKGDLDNSALVTVTEDLAGVEIRKKE